MAGRFATRISVADDWNSSPRHPGTQLRFERAKSIISRNNSPDVPFSLSLNPYRGCEHGCTYCFARPSHSYLDLSPGLDFETRITLKTNADELFEQELQRPGYRCEPIAVGMNTDAYQPFEKQYGMTRRLLSIALAYRQPISLITKSSLILRDIDILSEMARLRLVHVAISVTTLDNELKRCLEPRTASGAMRLQVIQRLSEAGVPVTALIAPVIPLLNERELEHLVAAVADAGAESASYILLRLPHEVAPLFIDWLYQHYPDRAGHIIKRLEDMRGGRLYDNRYGHRMRGNGIFADLIRQRFSLALRKHQLPARRQTSLDSSQFQPPTRSGQQLGLF